MFISNLAWHGGARPGKAGPGKAWQGGAGNRPYFNLANI